MKIVSIILLSAIATIAFAQRPWYLGQGSGQVGLPTLSDRFKTDNDDNKIAPLAVPNPNDYYSVPSNGIPIDAHGDIALVNRLKQWPEENQPFWLLNADQIEAHRGTHRNTAVPVWLPGYGYYGVPYYPDTYNYQNYYEGGGNHIVDEIVLLDD